jgi:hypothetical protein
VTVRSAQLSLVPIPLPGVDQFMYQVPVGRRTLLKQITMEDPAATTITIGVRVGGGPLVSIIFRRTLTAGIDTSLAGLFVVVNSGDILTARSSLTTTATVGLYGAELVL